MPGLVHIVDDDASFRTAMERRLTKAGYKVAIYASAQHLLDRLPGAPPPCLPRDNILGCILLDVLIPGMSGPELQVRLSELGSTLPIIFLTGHPDIPTPVQVIKADADDFLTKPVTSDDLLRAIETAFARHEVSRDLQKKLDAVRAHIATLTPRERQVFALVIRGKTNREVARTLGGTERTVKAPTPGDGENASSIPAGAGVAGRAGRCFGTDVQYLTDAPDFYCHPRHKAWLVELTLAKPETFLSSTTTPRC